MRLSLQLWVMLLKDSLEKQDGLAGTVLVTKPAHLSLIPGRREQIPASCPLTFTRYNNCPPAPTTNKLKHSK